MSTFGMGAAYDVAIVGGGVMGCATAYHLLRLQPAMRVAVIERDSSYEHASTTRSDGNVRIQFNLEENIRMSQYAMDVLATFADDFEVDGVRPEPACRHQGNLFTVDAAGREAAEAGMALQQQLGCDVRWMSADEIAASFPLFAPAGLVGGTFGPRDGAVDPHAVLHGYRRKAARLGAEFIEDEVVNVHCDDGAATGISAAAIGDVAAPVVVNTAGAWAADLARTAGVEIPVQPVMRSVFIVESGRLADARLPSVFTPSGAYALPEGDGRFLMAWSRPSDPVGYDFTHRQSEFYDVVWPELIACFPNLDRLRVVGGWAGLYAQNTLDGNAILGEWPDLRGLYLACGFSGHGFQQCHAVGRYLAELVLDEPLSLDLSRFGPARVLAGEPVFEHAGRII